MAESMKKVRLGECLLMIKNGAVIKQTKEGKGLPITRIETLSNNQFNRNRMGYADIFSTESLEEYILEDGDLIMSHINSREFLGRTVIYEKLENETIIHGMNVLRIKTDPLKLLPYYAYYLFQTEYFKKLIQGIRKDAIGQSSIAISDISNLLIEIPNINIQERRLQILRRIDKKIAINREINRNLYLSA